MSPINRNSGSSKKRIGALVDGIRLELFQDANFSGRRIVFRRRGVAVRNMFAFNFNDQLSSFRMRFPANPNRLTLVLWQDVNYQGNRLIFRGQQAVNFVGAAFNDQMSSFVFVPAILTMRQINAIQAAGSAASLPVVEITV